MLLKTLIIDDEPIALEKLRSYVGKVPTLELVGACGNGFEAIDFLSQVDVDLIITDINMPDLNGLDFIKTLSKPPMVIFTTAYSQYAVDSYKVSAIDYLLKPYGFVDFNKAVNKAIEVYSSRCHQHMESVSVDTSDSIFIKVDYRYVRVALADIRFIKGYGEYLQIYISGKTSPLVTLSSFASIRGLLTDDFLQVHRSYIVNMNQVEQIERNRVVMDHDNFIPVGDSYKTMFQEYLMSHSVGKGRK
ncbi:LytTR family DNA-binding domain-containing protein [Duncaniella freteri]|uniref:LytR/AlgR family response regulator transcription factor n=1 Tax=Duncaniella freteri TaxID=2530391 RepID=UPI002577D5EA|nr:LytTR family DNA-binding domain-containing protein [Duncaniella freteri]